MNEFDTQNCISRCCCCKSLHSNRIIITSKTEKLQSNHAATNTFVDISKYQHQQRSDHIWSSSQNRFKCLQTQIPMRFASLIDKDFPYKLIAISVLNECQHAVQCISKLFPNKNLLNVCQQRSQPLINAKWIVATVIYNKKVFKYQLVRNFSAGTFQPLVNGRCIFKRIVYKENLNKISCMQPCVSGITINIYLSIKQESHSVHAGYIS